MNLFNKFFLLLVFSTLSQNLFSQTTGSIKGIVVDTSRTPVSGASIVISGSNKSVVTDSKGEFILDNLNPGNYKISISYSGLKTRSETFTIQDSNRVDLGILMLQVEVTDFTRKGKIFYRPKKYDAGTGIQEVKKSEQVLSVTTSDEMKNSQNNDAAKAAARIPGVTLMENRFIMIRGLSQRYNSVQINNINAPSTEVDRRAFSFDLIPSSMLDKIAIFKSPSSDLAGDFAGGVIKLQTKNEIEKDFFTVNLGFGYRINTTFKSHENNSVGSSTDLMGFDNGNRALPGSFPQSLDDLNSGEAVAIGKTMRNNFSLRQMNAPLDFGFGFGFGKNFTIKKLKFFTINNFGYSTNYQFSAMDRYRYQNEGDSVRQMFNYRDDVFSIESKFSILSNWILKVGKKTSFTFKNIFNQIGENETTLRTGVNLTERPSDEFRNYSFHYTSRSIYFGQFEGEHKLAGKDKLVYTLGYSNISRDEPDYRRFRTYRSIGSNDQYTMIDPPSASLFDAARFYSKLKESTMAGNVNYETHFSYADDSTGDWLVLRLGTYMETKQRDFSARWLSYSYTGNPMNKNEFLQQPVDRIFSEENINTAGGFKPVEGTNPSDHYEAANQLMAGYVNASIPFGDFNFNLGLRTEYFNQTLNSATNNGPVNVVLDSLNILPSINASYYLNKKNLMRIAYGKTINRPEFRELAPFVYYDFMYDVNIVGNPSLKPATIDNMDIRFENYPTKNETVSLGFFYKRFVNPIENYVQPVGLSQQFYLKNAKSATNRGVELEVRKSFAENSQNFIIKKLSLVLNASYIISEVDLGDDSTLSQARTRPLQGQSPYIANMALQYKDDSGLVINVAYNIFGKRIIYVGNNIFPTVYEMPRHSLDITVTKEINKKFNIKFGVSDLLNYKHQLWQDKNGDGKIDYNNPANDQQLLQYRRGQLFSISLAYKIR